MKPGVRIEWAGTCPLCERPVPLTGIVSDVTELEGFCCGTRLWAKLQRPDPDRFTWHTHRDRPGATVTWAAVETYKAEVWQLHPACPDDEGAFQIFAH